MRPPISDPRSGWTRLPDDILPSIAFMAVWVSVCITTRLLTKDLNQGARFYCDPTDSVMMPHRGLSSAWDMRYMFSITLAWGDFSLSTAKLIDICWDLIVGRGGQLLLSYLAFRTFRRSIIQSLERNSWHLQVLTRQILDPVSLLGLWAAIKEIVQPNRPYQVLDQHLDSPQSRQPPTETTLHPPNTWPKRLYSFVFVVTYILAFTTIVSAMTGYRASMDPAYRGPNGTVVSLARHEPVYPVEIRGWQKGWPDDIGNHKAFQRRPCDEFFNGNYSGSAVLTPGADCIKAWHEYRETLSVCEKISGHGVLADRDWRLPTILKSDNAIRVTTKSHLNFTTPETTSSPGTSAEAVVVDGGSCRANTSSPLAAIEWLAYDNGYFYLTTSNITINGQTWKMEMPPAIVLDWNESDLELIDREDYRWPRYFRVETPTGEATISSEWLEKDNMLCQPTKRYQWGFSSLLLFYFTIATVVTGIILVALNVSVWMHGPDHMLKMTISVYRDILDLAGEIKAELGDDAEDMSPETLDDRITTNTGNAKIIREAS